MTEERSVQRAPGLCTYLVRAGHATAQNLTLPYI